MATSQPGIFPGDSEERDALLTALGAACACRSDQDGKAQICAAHTLLHDEHAVKYLIFLRRFRARLWPEDG